MTRIIAAVDDSSISELVVAQAVDLARSLGGKVKIVHAVVIPPQVAPLPGAGVFAAPPTSLVPDMLAAAETLVKRLLESVPEELRDGSNVEVGNAADVVCELARCCEADVVVIGAHKYSAVARVLGTTAAKIVNRMDRPVLVVRPVPEAEATHAGRPSSDRTAEGRAEMSRS